MSDDDVEPTGHCPQDSDQVFTTDDLDQAVKSFSARPDFNRPMFERKMQGIGWFFKEARTLEGQTSAPSIQERRWRRRASQLRAISKRLQNLGWQDHGVLLNAARDLAKNGVPPPNFEAAHVEMQPLASVPRDQAKAPPMVVWPVESQFTVALRNIEWLARCAQEAAQHAGAAKASGGSQPDSAKYELFREVTKLYREAALKPSSLYRDRETDEPRGELLQLLAKCLEGLGEADSPGTIYETYFRAVPGDERPRHPSGDAAEA